MGFIGLAGSGSVGIANCRDVWAVLLCTARRPQILFR